MPPKKPAGIARRAPTSPLDFSNVRILVRDFAASWRFYRDVLGLTPGVGDDSGPYAEFLWNGEARLGLFDRALMAKATGRPDARAATKAVGAFALILRTDNVDRVHAQLSSRGVVFLRGPTDRKEWRLRTIHLADPDGNVVELNSDLPA
jgi:catechol 2,3-dioxygenase-like lactoylglutathione lyase family enzyme